MAKNRFDWASFYWVRGVKIELKSKVVRVKPFRYAQSIPDTCARLYQGFKQSIDGQAV